MTIISHTTQERASASGGTCSHSLYSLIANVMQIRSIAGGIMLDVGCGQGRLRSRLADRFEQYIGIDAISYPEFPATDQFIQSDVDVEPLPVQDAIADVVIAAG